MAIRIPCGEAANPFPRGRGLGDRKGRPYAADFLYWDGKPVPYDGVWATARVAPTRQILCSGTENLPQTAYFLPLLSKK